MPDFVLSVIHSDDTKYDYNVNSFMTVGHLMKLITQQKHISEFRLVKGKIFLDMDCSLQDYDITPEDTLIMIENSMRRIMPTTNSLQEYDIASDDTLTAIENHLVLRRVMPTTNVAMGRILPIMKVNQSNKK